MFSVEMLDPPPQGPKYGASGVEGWLVGWLLGELSRPLVLTCTAPWQLLFSSSSFFPLGVLFRLCTEFGEGQEWNNNSNTNNSHQSRRRRYQVHYHELFAVYLHDRPNHSTIHQNNHQCLRRQFTCAYTWKQVGIPIFPLMLNLSMLLLFLSARLHV